MMVSFATREFKGVYYDAPSEKEGNYFFISYVYLNNSNKHWTLNKTGKSALAASECKNVLTLFVWFNITF